MYCRITTGWDAFNRVHCEVRIIPAYTDFHYVTKFITYVYKHIYSTFPMKSGFVTNINYLGLLKEHTGTVACSMWKKAVLAIGCNKLANCSRQRIADNYLFP